MPKGEQVRLVSDRTAKEVERNLSVATDGIQAVLRSLEELFQAAYGEAERKEWTKISHSLNALYEDHVTQSGEQKDVFPSLLESSGELLRRVESLFDEVLEQPFHLDLPDAGRSETPGNAHSCVWQLAFQVKLEYQKLLSAAEAILRLIESLPPATYRMATAGNDPDAIWFTPDFPCHVRFVGAARDMVHCAARKPGWTAMDLVRAPFFDFLRSMKPDFMAIRAAMRKEVDLGRRYLYEGRLSETAIALAAASLDPCDEGQPAELATTEKFIPASDACRLFRDDFPSGTNDVKRYAKQKGIETRKPIAKSTGKPARNHLDVDLIGLARSLAKDKGENQRQPEQGIVERYAKMRAEREARTKEK